MSVRLSITCLCVFFALSDFSRGLAAQNESDSKTVVSGQVVGENGEPVADVVVREIGWKKDSRPATTDKEGRFAVTIEERANGKIDTALSADSTDGRMGFVSVTQLKTEPIRLVVKAARELTVVVHDRDGKPTKNAEVQFLAEMRLLLSGVTSAEGRFACRVPADVTRWAVIARKSQLGFDYSAAERERGSGDRLHPLPKRLTLNLDGARTVRVKVVDRDAKPVEGISIGPWYLRKPGRETEINLSGTTSLWPVTGADGCVVLDWIPEQFKQDLLILIKSEQYYSADHASSIVAEKPVDELTINLLPLEKLSGRVTHADGQPAAGMAVVVHGQGTSHRGFHGAARTDRDGRYELKVYSEQAYLVAAGDENWAAPCRADILVRAGQPVDHVDLVLGPTTRLHGRVTVGKDHRPVANTWISAVIDKGPITKELPRKADDRRYYALRMNFNAQTDAEGKYEFRLAPGDYQLRGPARTETVKLSIPAVDSTAEIVQDFHMPRAESGPFAGRVVDRAGKPVPGAIVEGQYASIDAQRWFGETKADEHGAFQIERSLDPLVIHARSADGKLAGVVRSDSEATQGEIVVAPTASASGRLKDMDGKPLAQKELRYGIRIYQGEPLSSPFSDHFGGTTMTDANGNFTLARLVPGEEYQLSIKLDESSSRNVTEVTAKDSQPLAVGDLSVDPNPTKPYVPPTPAERAAEGFAAKREMPPQERLEGLLAEARREYTRPLLLFGKPTDPACIELYRLFYESDQDSKDADAEKQDMPLPNELRWEFELAALDLDRAELHEFASKMKIDISAGNAPLLAVFSSDGSLTETQELDLKDGKLDGRDLGAWMAKHKLPTRDARKMLDDALAKAKSEDKRVFFILSASWCGPCRMLARFLAAHKLELEQHFVFVKLDISRDENADELREHFKESASGGVPWYCILDTDAKVLTTSNLPKVNPRYGTSNMGFPTQPAEVDHFLGMLKSTAPRLGDEKLAQLRAALLEKK